MKVRISNKYVNHADFFKYIVSNFEISSIVFYTLILKDLLCTLLNISKSNLNGSVSASSFFDYVNLSIYPNCTYLLSLYN